MSDAAVARADIELRMLEAMVDCAFALGSAFGELANAEPNVTAKCRLFEAFTKSFQGVRMGIRLSMALRAGPKPVVAAAEAGRAVPVRPEGPERERLEIEPLELGQGAAGPTAGPPRFELERDRDDEPVSLPKFLATLGLVATEAQGVRDRLPAEIVTRTLPALQGLLARAAPTHAAPAGSAPVGTAPAARTALAAPAGASLLLAQRPPTRARASLMGSAAPAARPPPAVASPPTPLSLLGSHGRPRPPPR